MFSPVTTVVPAAVVDGTAPSRPIFFAPVFKLASLMPGTGG